jgi:competence protein ComEC
MSFFYTKTYLLKKALLNFWEEAPALFYGINFILGESFYLIEKPFLLLVMLLFNLLNVKKSHLGLIIMIVGYAYALFCYPSIKENFSSPLEGEGYFEPASIKQSSSFNQNCFVYKGLLKTFKTSEKTYKNIPCSIYFKQKKDITRPKANFYYSLKGNLIKKQDFTYVLKSKDWQKKEKLFSLSELRFQAKNFVKSHLKKTLHSSKVFHLLSALITGDVDDQFLYFSFARAGLQHILAISGYHFVTLVIFFSFFFRIFFSKNISIYLLIIIVNLYFLFVGSFPSVQRSWVMIQVALIAQLFTKKYFSLNALGISLIIVCFDPLSLINKGFQLSFLSVAAILIIYPTVDRYLSNFLKNRTLKEKQELHLVAKFGYKISSFIRQSLSLSIAVNLTILPVVLFCFYKLPILSFIYNLFVPLFISFSIILLMTSMILYLIYTPLAFPINFINELFTQYVLNLVAHPPIALQFYIRNKHLNFEFVMTYIFLILILFIYLQYSNKDQTFEPLKKID